MGQPSASRSTAEQAVDLPTINPPAGTPSLADRLRNAAAQPIATDTPTKTPQAADPHEDAARLMQSMEWSVPRAWDANLSGQTLFDALWRLDGIRIGKPGSPRRMVMFSDPGTGFDLALARQIHAAGPGLDADILVLPLGTGMFDPASATKATVLSCLPNPSLSWLEWSLTPPDARASSQSAWEVFTSRHAIPKSCDKGPALMEIFQAAQALEVGHTPYVIFPSGEAWPTSTPSLAALLASLEYEGGSIDHPSDRVLNEQ